MTKAAHGVLLYLDRYLLEHPKKRRALRDLYLRTTSRELHEGHLWKHTKRKVEPNLSTTLVYLVFLSKAGELLPAKTPGLLFTYKNPQYLSEKPRKTVKS